jgi:hypothetical protein
LDRIWLDFRAGPEDVEKRKIVNPQGLELLHLCLPARSQSLYTLRYTGG